MTRLKVCFFSREGVNHISKQQYSLQDIRILNEYGFDVVIASDFWDIPWNCDLYFSWWASGSFLPLIVAKLCSKPIFVVAGGNEVIDHIDSLYGFKAGYGSSNVLKRLAVITTLKTATQLFVVSTHMVGHVLRISAREPIVLYNSVDTERFIPQKLLRTYITSVINFDEISYLNKRGLLLMEAFVRVSPLYADIGLLLIGKSSHYLTYLKKYAETLGIKDKVKFVSDLNNIDLPEYLNTSKLYVQLSDTETFGMALVEAMSLEIPVVCSKKGAFLEVTGGLGIYCDNNDIDSITSAIFEGLTLSNESYNRIGRELRLRVLELFDFNSRKEFLFRQFDNLFKH